MVEKICKITNGNFGRILEVDNEVIVFSGIWSAEYFEKHYKELGYTVEIVDEQKPTDVPDTNVGE